MPSNEIHCESKCKVKKEDYRGIEEKDDKQAHKKNVTQVHHKQKVSSVSLQFFFLVTYIFVAFSLPFTLGQAQSNNRFGAPTGISVQKLIIPVSAHVISAE